MGEAGRIGRDEYLVSSMVSKPVVTIRELPPPESSQDTLSESVISNHKKNISEFYSALRKARRLMYLTGFQMFDSFFIRMTQLFETSRKGVFSPMVAPPADRKSWEDSIAVSTS